MRRRRPFALSLSARPNPFPSLTASSSRPFRCFVPGSRRSCETRTRSATGRVCWCFQSRPGERDEWRSGGGGRKNSVGFVGRSDLVLVWVAAIKASKAKEAHPKAKEDEHGQQDGQGADAGERQEEEGRGKDRYGVLQRRYLPVEEPRDNQQDAYSAAQRDARSQKEGPLVARGGGGSRVPARRREERRQVRSLRHGHVSPAGGLPPRQRFGCRVLQFLFFGFWMTSNISGNLSSPKYRTDDQRVFGHIFGVSCQTGWDRKLRTGDGGVSLLTRGCSHWTWGTQEGTWPE